MGRHGKLSGLYNGGWRVGVGSLRFFFFHILLFSARFFTKIQETLQFSASVCNFSLYFLFERHNGPASAAPCQEGHFWKRSETKKANSSRSTKTQIRAVLQELLEILPAVERTMRFKCAKTVGSEKPVSE